MELRGIRCTWDLLPIGENIESPGAYFKGEHIGLGIRTQYL